jgi:PKD repeat protein
MLPPFSRGGRPVIAHAKGMMKAGGAAVFGLFTGAAMMYGRAAVDKVVKPTQPLANFSVGATDGLTVTFHNQAAGDAGYWDFGDGSPLEAFEPARPVAHTYPKPGTYTAKLTVRNFLMEEKERAVTVDVAATPVSFRAPRVTVSVEPIGKHSVAPATFRVRGTVENVERAFLDLGDTVEVRTEGGSFEQLVVIDRPGEFPIQLIGHSGRQAVKDAARVRVTGDAVGSYAAVVRVVDSGTRVVRDGWRDLIPVAGKRFDKLAPARPGFILTSAKADGAVKGVASLAVALTPDRQAVRVTGELADGVAEAMVPVATAGDRTLTATAPPQLRAESFDGRSPVTVPLPPAPRGLTNLTRKVSVELKVTGPDGRPQTVARADDLAKPWTQPTKDGRVIRAELAGDAVRVSVGR